MIRLTIFTFFCRSMPLTVIMIGKYPITLYLVVLILWSGKDSIWGLVIILMESFITVKGHHNRLPLSIPVVHFIVCGSFQGRGCHTISTNQQDCLLCSGNCDRFSMHANQRFDTHSIKSNVILAKYDEWHLTSQSWRSRIITTTWDGWCANFFNRYWGAAVYRKSRAFR